MISYALIVNPASGRGRGIRRAELLRTGLGGAGSVQLLTTTRRGEATELACEAARRVDRIIAIGGDGTLNEVLNGLIDSGLEPADLPELGFLPAGTANAAGRAFGSSLSPGAMARALAHAESIPVDVGIVRHEGGERAFMLWLGAGWDAVVIHTLNAERSGRMGVSGLISEVPRMLSAISRYRQPRITTEVDGSIFGEHASLIIANVGATGFGGMVAPEAEPGDGRFDIVGLPHFTIFGSIRMGARLFTSSLIRCQGVSHSLGSLVTLSAAGTVPFHVDGEPVGELPATVTMRPGAIRFLKP